MSLKVGNKDWVDFKFVLDMDHIDVMEQPKGTLCAIAYKDGELTDLGKQIMKSNTLIHDVGFGTEDDFGIRAGYRDNKDTHTFSDTGMKSVFEKTIAQLSADYPIDVKIFEFQKYLVEGKVTYFDQNEMSVNEVDFQQLLLDSNTALCEKSTKRLLQEYDNLMAFNYLVVTGGTGESRFEQIVKFFEKNPRLQVLPGNLNTPDLPFSYSNVIGYYMFRHAKTVSEMKKAGAI